MLFGFDVSNIKRFINYNALDEVEFDEFYDFQDLLGSRFVIEEFDVIKVE